MANICCLFGFNLSILLTEGEGNYLMCNILEVSFVSQHPVSSVQNTFSPKHLKKYIIEFVTIRLF